MKYFKRICILLISLALAGMLTACNLAGFELGGLVGELLQGAQGGGVVDEYDPSRPQLGGWGEDVTMAPGEQLYGFPASLQLQGDVTVYETEGPFSAFAETEVEVFAQGKMAMTQQFVDLYGYSVTHSFADAETVMEIAKKEAAAGHGELSLCYLPLSYIGRISTSGVFHSNQTLAQESGAWGSDSLNADLRINGVQYAFVGYLTPGAELASDCLIYNQDIMDECGYDIVTAVNDDVWTLAEYGTLCKNVFVDLDADGSVSSGDRFGAAYDTDTMFDHLFYGSGLALFDNGKVNDRQSDLMQYAFDLAEFVRAVSYRENDAKQLFLEGRALFYASSLEEYLGLVDGEPMLLEASFATGVVPTPVYEIGIGYTANVDPNAINVLAVPHGAQGDVDMTLNVLGVLAANHLMPAREQWITKVCDSEQTVSLCYRVINAASFDVDSVMLRAEGIACNPFDGSPASFIEAQKAQLESQLAQIYEVIGSLGK